MKLHVLVGMDDQLIGAFTTATLAKVYKAQAGEGEIQVEIDLLGKAAIGRQLAAVPAARGAR